MNDFIPEDVEAPISFTGKIGGNLMTIRGNTAEEFIQRVDAFIEQGGIDKAAEFNDLCNAASAVKEGFSGNRGNGNGGAQRQSSSNRQGGNAGQRQSAPQNNDTEQHPEGLQCSSCGQVVVYKKIAKGNRTFELWTCPNQRQRNDGHHSEFIN